MRTIAICLLAAAVPLLGAEPGLAQPATVTCTGAEPFWSLTIDGDRARLSSPNPEIANVGPEIAGVRKNVRVAGQTAVHWRGKAKNGAGDVVAWLVLTACTMPSGEPAPYQILLSLPGAGPVAGCCR